MDKMCRKKALTQGLIWLMLPFALLLRVEVFGADGAWVLGPDLGLTGQTNWSSYSGGDAPEGAYMGWLYAGNTNTPGTIDLKRNLPAGNYYVMLKIIDYMGRGKVTITGGNGMAIADTLNDDWNKYWTVPVSFQTTQTFNTLRVTLLKTIAITNVQKYLFRGLYITTNGNENVPLYGYDRIEDWTYPTGTNSGPAMRRNLVENGSFEVGVGHGWGFMAQGYERDFPFSSCWETNQGWHGTGSFRFPSDSSKLISRTYKVSPNRNFNLSAWVRSSAPSGISLGVYNVATPPPGFPSVQNLYQSFPTTTNWTRISLNGFLPAYPDPNYQVRISANSNVWVDGVHLQEAGFGGPSVFQPHAAIEIGFVSDKPGRILFDDENPALQLLAFNSSTGAFSGTMSFEVYDIFNRKIAAGEQPLSVAAAQRSTQNFPLPVKRGIFRVVAWVKGVEGTLEEVVYAVLPRPRVLGINEASVIGVHPNLMSFELAMHQRLGIKWARAMSPESIFRWSKIEPIEGQIAWYDVKVNRATNYGISIMGTIGSNDYWPPWADTNGLPNLDKWETFVEALVTHYRGRVHYWEVWNEPIYNFTSQFYADLLKRAAAAIRRADPNAKIIGMGGVYSKDWILQVMGFLGSNWRQYLDYISTHLYPPGNEPSGGETEERAVNFKKQVIDPYGVEVWNTETGVWDEGFYKTANSGFAPPGEPMRPYLDSERYFQGCFYEAELMLVNFLHCLGNGLTKYFYYDSRIYADPSYQRSHPTMLEYDDSIRSKGIVYGIAAYFLDGSRGLGNVSPATNTTYAYLFDRSNSPTVVVWSKDKVNHSIQLAATGCKAFDMMGNQITVTNSSIPFGRTPVYVQSDSLTTDALRAAFQNAVVSNLTDTMPPGLSIDDFPTGPIPQGDISLRWLGIDETSIPSPMAPDAMTYSYKLDGRDTNWSAWTSATHVLLISVPFGTYTFHVRARDAAGNISAIESRSIVVNLAPPRNLGISN